MPTDNESNGGKERNMGILTQGDKEVLSRQKVLTGSAERDSKYRIRERTKNGIRDLALLARELGQKDRELIFDSVDDMHDRSLEEALSFLLSAKKTGDSPVPKFTEEVERLLTMALIRMGELNGEIYEPEISVEINTKSADTSDTIQRILESEGTTLDIDALSPPGREKLFQEIADGEEIISVSDVGPGETDRKLEITPHMAESWLDHNRSEDSK